MQQIETFLILVGSIISSVMLLHKLRINGILGYLLAGAILGPNFSSVIPEISQIEFLGELGIILMLFNIGIELPMNRIKALRIFIFGIGGLQFLILAPLLSIISYHLLHLNFVNSIVVGASFSFASTAMIMQVLSSQSELASRFGRITFSTLLFQDLAVVPMMIFTNLAYGGIDISQVLGKISIQILIALLVVIAIGRFLLKPLFKVASTNKEQDIFLLITFFVITALSFITMQGGLSSELGAFLAGMMMAETKYRHQIENEIAPFKGILLGMFFVTVGAHLNFAVLFDHYFLISVLLISILVIKTFIGYFVNFLFSISNYASIRSAFILGGSGEFIFVILSHKGIDMNSEIINIIFCTVILSMILTPFFDYIARVIVNKKASRNNHSKKRKNNQHVALIGFDEVGQDTAKVLELYKVPYTVIDYRISKIDQWQQEDVPIIYLDTTKSNIFSTIDFSHISLFIINLKNEQESVNLAKYIRSEYPNVKMIVRYLNKDHEKMLSDVDAIILQRESIVASNSVIGSLIKVLDINDVNSLDLLHKINPLTISLCRQEAYEDTD